MLNLIARLKLKTRLYLLLASMLLGLLVLGGYSVFELRQHMLEEKYQAIRAVVNASMAVLERAYELQQ